MGRVTVSEHIRSAARELIAARLGLRVPDDRSPDLDRALLRLRPSRVSLAGYLHFLETRPDDDPEWLRLAGQLTIGETYFFRDPAVFEALENQILPDLIAARRAEGMLRLRLWSAGCATGEEAYSLAIVLDRVLPDKEDWAVTILATDISATALEAARRGIYRPWSFRQTPALARELYFQPRGAESFEIAQAFRQSVSFTPLNLAGDGYPSLVTNTTAMDLILCRNVLMYFTDCAARAAAGRLHRALAPGGWLAVSPAETSVDLFKPLRAVTFPSGAVFYRNDGEPEVVAAPSRPTFAATEPWQEMEMARNSHQLDAAAEESGERSGRETEDGVRDPVICSADELDDRGESSLRPQESGPGFDEVRGLADAGYLEQAHRLARTQLVRQPLSAEGWLLLAAISQELGHLQESQEALRRAIYLSPDLAAAHFMLGALLIRLQKLQRGRRSLRTAAALLERLPAAAEVPGAAGLTAARLKQIAESYLGGIDG